GYTSAPSCAPSRASVLTGRNFWQNEEGAFIQAWIPEKFPVFPDILKKAGYHVGRTGKGWGPGVYPEGAHGPGCAGAIYNDIMVKDPQEKMNPLDYPANFEKFLEDRAEGQPFYFWVGTTEPHGPYAPDNHQKLEQKYGVTLDDIAVPGFLPDTPGIRRDRANFLYEVCYADDQLGRIIQILEDRGELENTLLIATGDNGTATARAKATPYDWGVHEPLAIMWPARVKGGRVVEDFVNFPDLAPTMLEAAGAPVPDSMSGRSIVDILLSGKEGQVDPTRDFIVTGVEWHGELPPFNRASRMVRDNRYEYVVYYGNMPVRALNPDLKSPDAEFEKNAEKLSLSVLLSKHPDHPKVKPFADLLTTPPAPEELYDLEKDPWQMKNVIDDPAYAEIRDRLKAQLKAYQLKTGDPRATGDLEAFTRARAFVEGRKARGYKD
ncbi:sulfatase, partial [bacterium]|nr:sulfatase [bacterium]